MKECFTHPEAVFSNIASKVKMMTSLTRTRITLKDCNKKCFPKHLDYSEKSVCEVKPQRPHFPNRRCQIAYNVIMSSVSLSYKGQKINTFFYYISLFLKL